MPRVGAYVIPSILFSYNPSIAFAINQNLNNLPTDQAFTKRKQNWRTTKGKSICYTKVDIPLEWGRTIRSMQSVNLVTSYRIIDLQAYWCSCSAKTKCLTHRNIYGRPYENACYCKSGVALNVSVMIIITGRCLAPSASYVYVVHSLYCLSWAICFVFSFAHFHCILFRIFVVVFFIQG